MKIYPPTRPIFLKLDAHSSHLNFDILEKVKQNQIELIYLEHSPSLSRYYTPAIDYRQLYFLTVEDKLHQTMSEIYVTINKV